MVVYRIDRLKRKKEVLSGIGAEKVGGRWNAVGTKAVYTSQNRSLAYLEVVMHLDITEDLPDDRIIAHIEIPDDIAIETLKSLPRQWNSFPYNSKTQKLFTIFCENNEAAVLKVPSAIIKEEFNFILNPLHEDFKKIKVIKTEPFTFDTRLQNLKS